MSFKLADLPRSPAKGGYCEHLISPGFLNRCSLYRRNEHHDPEKCWDGSAHPELPESVRLSCPNNTATRTPLIFTEEQLRTYPLFGKKRESIVESSSTDEKPLEPETTEEG